MTGAHEDIGINSGSNVRRYRWLRLYCAVSAIAVTSVGCLVLMGWAFHIEFLKSVFPGFVTMKANTAICTTLSGSSLWLLLGESSAKRTLVARVLALSCVLIAAASLGQYLFGWDLGIDQLLFGDVRHSYGTSSPGRMAPPTAAAFLAIGVALVVLDRKTRTGRQPAQILSLVSGLIALLALSGYIYDATVLTRIQLYTQIAVNTSAVLVLLSSAIFFSRPKSGIATDLTGAGSGSNMARRFLPAVLFVPVILGWICLRGETAGLYGAELGIAIYSTGTILIFASLVWLSARTMNVEYYLRNAAQTEIHALNAHLEERIAERTRTLEQQAAALAGQAALLDLARDAIIVRDMQDQIVFWNRGAEAMYGWRKDEVLGANKFELLKGRFSQPLETIKAELLLHGHWEGEAIHARRDGTSVTVVGHWALERDAAGEPLRILEINNDITLSKVAEETLLRTMAELKRSNEELAQFAAVASHDLQEPLRMVASYTELLSRRYKGKLDAEGDEFLAFALDGAIRMQRLIRDLLTYSRIGSKGKEMRNVSSEDALQQALKQLSGAMKDSGAKITHDPLPAVLADETQLIQLFQNLIGNAIKYQNKDIPRIHVSAALDGAKKWMFSVRDNGLGISPQNFDRIFGMFQRLHKRDEFDGTGIGLAICKKIVERHGGNISVESELGRGSNFQFALSGSERTS